MEIGQVKDLSQPGAGDTLQQYSTHISPTVIAESPFREPMGIGDGLIRAMATDAAALALELARTPVVVLQSGDSEHLPPTFYRSLIRGEGTPDEKFERLVSRVTGLFERAFDPNIANSPIYYREAPLEQVKMLGVALPGQVKDLSGWHNEYSTFAGDGPIGYQVRTLARALHKPNGAIIDIHGDDVYLVRQREVARTMLQDVYANASSDGRTPERIAMATEVLARALRYCLYAQSDTSSEEEHGGTASAVDMPNDPTRQKKQNESRIAVHALLSDSHTNDPLCDVVAAILSKKDFFDYTLGQRTISKLQPGVDMARKSLRAVAGRIQRLRQDLALMEINEAADGDDPSGPTESGRRSIATPDNVISRIVLEANPLRLRQRQEEYAKLVRAENEGELSSLKYGWRDENYRPTEIIALIVEAFSNESTNQDQTNVLTADMVYALLKSTPVSIEGKQDATNVWNYVVFCL